MTDKEMKLQRSIDDASKIARRHWLDSKVHNFAMKLVRELTQVQKERATK